MTSDGGKRAVRVSARILLALLTTAALVLGTMWTALWLENRGAPSTSVRGTGHDAMWLGHAWVDGRKGQSDVDALAKQLSATGIRDLFVHTGPFDHDGTLNRGRLPQGRWFVEAVHRALPGVRVQAWLGAHPVPGQMNLRLESTQAHLLTSTHYVLDQGFDGIHYDFEPIADGDTDHLTVLRKTRAVTKQRRALLSVSAIHNEPWKGMAACFSLLPGRFALWTEEYLRRVALEVDQVALMAYDTALPTQAIYAGYVRRATEAALRAVPADVALFIGVPAYHDQRIIRQSSAETVAAAVRGIQLAVGDRPLRREFGVAMYVDFAATESDWAAYHENWTDRSG